MSGALQTLQRLRRREVDAVKDELASVLAQIADCDARAAHLRAQAEAETLAAMGDPLAASMLGAYTQQVRGRLTTIAQQRTFWVGQEDRVRDALATAFLEEKKIEQLIEAQALAAEAAVAAADAAAMDEMAISRAGRFTA